jgi:hypothetical protein
VLVDFAPAATAPLAAALDQLLEELLAASAGGAGRGRAARSIVAALVAAGAEGAELWIDEDHVRGGWRRVAGAGRAVPDGERHARGGHEGYPGAVAAVRAGALALVFSGALPGSDERERREELAETLLVLAEVLCAAADDDAGLDEPGGPLRAA